jgi:two-component system chemotaxis sensor kinase CheA
MSTDMDQFKGTFIAESFELLEEMEEKLMSLDHEAELDMEEINAIFRCAHSIKGGAGAFGFNRLVGFTHILEFLLDALRTNQVNISEEIVEALLKSVDIVTTLVRAAQTGNDPEVGYEDELSAVLKGLCNADPTPKTATQASSSKPENSVATTPSEKTFNIKFVPSRSLFASGNEPLYIIRELQKSSELTTKIDISKIPEIFDMDPEDCYISWNIAAKTKEDISIIKEAFEFVEDECKLTIEEAGSAPANDLSEEDDFGGVFIDALQNLDQSNKPAATSLADEDEFGGVFMDALQSLPQQPVAQQPNEPQVVKAAPVQSNKPAASASEASPEVASIRVDIQKIDTMVNMVGELVITQAMIMQQTKDLPADKHQKLIQGIEELARHTRELQEAVMAVRMQPVKSVFSRLPRIVRDLSRKLNKQVSLEMRGENTEIDKTVIERLSDPLTHMIRNSVDHGIETPEKRIAAGKDAEGVITLAADNTGGRILIEISDNGGGINRERVLKKAVEKGLVAADANISEKEIDNLIFHAGFSTAETVSDVSGRGVGMDVVNRNIKDLGGEIEMINRPGHGTTFYISLPLTLAILDGMVIGVSNEKYIIPISNIIETMSLKSSEINKIANGDDVINVRGEFIPIIYLNKIFNTLNAEIVPEKTLVVLVEQGKERLGIVVDDLIGQQQVVIKNLEENSDPVAGISGATILGDGNVSLILDIAQLQRMRVDSNFKPKRKIAA